jgi:hypothetical protein
MNDDTYKYNLKRPLVQTFVRRISNHASHFVKIPMLSYMCLNMLSEYLAVCVCLLTESHWLPLAPCVYGCLSVYVSVCLCVCGISLVACALRVCMCGYVCMYLGDCLRFPSYYSHARSVLCVYLFAESVSVCVSLGYGGQFCQ